MNLWQLIKELEIINKNRWEKKEINVVFDFWTAQPTTFASWRWDYSQLALWYELCWYDDSEKHCNDCELSDFIKECKSVIWKKFIWWKWWEFFMSEYEEIWVANPWNSWNTKVFNVIDNWYKVIIETRYSER